MKTYNDLYPKIYDFQNLLLAYQKARKCKRYRPEVLKFTEHLEENLIDIQNSLIYKTYEPGRYREFYVYDPKTRLVLAAPFRDRVVHHALCNLIEPIFDSTFISDSYACRNNKGTHKGVERLVYFLRKMQAEHGKVYALKCDIHHYFQSIDCSILEGLIRKKIWDRETQWLFHIILYSAVSGEGRAVGVPLGNLTSQLSGNIYLNELDHFVKQELKCKHYLRYMDDFILLNSDKAQLHEWLREIRVYLEERLLLKLNGKTSVFPINQGIDYLGYRIWPYKLLLRKKCITRMRRGMEYLAKHRDAYPQEHIQSVIASWYGHAQRADVPNLKDWLEQEAWEKFGIVLRRKEE